MVSCSGRRSRLVAATLLLTAAPASADITAHYVNAAGVIVIEVEADQGDAQVRHRHKAGAISITVEADDKGDTRVTQGDQYGVLTRDGITWILLSDRAGAFAVRREDWVAVIFSKVDGGAGSSPPARDTTGPEFDLVQGGRARVGGRTGTIWTLRPKHADAAHPGMARLDFVICDDADLAPIGRALGSQVAAGTEGMRAKLGWVPDIMQKMSDVLGKGTVIGMSRGMRLDSVDTRPIPASEFAVPATILTRDQYAARLQASRADARARP